MNPISFLQSCSFAHPQYFILLLILPVLYYFSFIKKKNENTFQVSSIENLKFTPITWRIKFQKLLPWLRILSVLFIIIALARPQSISLNESINSEGIDIVLCMDVSGSMLAEDFSPNRLEASKKIAKQFIEERIGDRIGLAIFSGESFTQCPLTTDKNVLINQLINIRSGLLMDGTAIGMGLATAVNRLRESKAKSKVIILMTDGVEQKNQQPIDPLTALELAKSFNTKVYTIGVGTKGEAPYPTQDIFGNIVMQNRPVEIDEALLQKIAKETGGNYYRATGNDALNNIYSQINKLEKTNVEINSFKQFKELFFPFAALGLLFLFLEILLSYTVLRSFP